MTDVSDDKRGQSQEVKAQHHQGNFVPSALSLPGSGRRSAARHGGLASSGDREHISFPQSRSDGFNCGWSVSRLLSSHPRHLDLPSLLCAIVPCLSAIGNRRWPQAWTGPNGNRAANAQMSSHRPRSGSASATPVPTPSPQPPPSEEESSSSQPSTSSRSRGAHSSQSHSHSRRSHQLGRHRTTPLAEEQPGLEVYYPQSSSPPPAAASPDVRVGRTRTRVAPSFWSKEVADNPSQFTFYRDPTPTPPEKREREKAGDYVGSPLPTQRPGRSSTVALETALTIPPPDTRRRPPRNDTICGLGRSMFFLAVAAVVLLVLGIAVGVGVGVGAGKKSIQSSQPAAASSR